MELLHSRIVWDGKWRVRVDTYRLADGQLYERGVVEHPGAVVLVPLVGRENGGEILMLQQYRVALDQTILELPAGTREPEEPWLECALRELREETGFRAASFVDLGFVWPAPGVSNERMAVVLAEELTPDPLPMDVDEEIVVETWPLDELERMALDGRLEDAKSVVAILRVADHLRKRAV